MINHITLNVTDKQRSKEFYIGFAFGLDPNPNLSKQYNYRY